MCRAFARSLLRGWNLKCGSVHRYFSRTAFIVEESRNFLLRVQSCTAVQLSKRENQQINMRRIPAMVRLLIPQEIWPI
jgi:hypothetical protein